MMEGEWVWAIGCGVGSGTDQLERLRQPLITRGSRAQAAGSSDFRTCKLDIQYTAFLNLK